uniref:Uncharacterized protein n=1 Tax=Lygus hesperus TaxID=30085 RepID=A0A0K8TDS4_LYGHE
MNNFVQLSSCFNGSTILHMQCNTYIVQFGDCGVVWDSCFHMVRKCYNSHLSDCHLRRFWADLGCFDGDGEEKKLSLPIQVGESNLDSGQCVPPWNTGGGQCRNDLWQGRGKFSITNRTKFHDDVGIFMFNLGMRHWANMQRRELEYEGGLLSVPSHIEKVRESRPPPPMVTQTLSAVPSNGPS